MGDCSGGKHIADSLNGQDNPVHCDRSAGAHLSLMPTTCTHEQSLNQSPAGQRSSSQQTTSLHCIWPFPPEQHPTETFYLSSFARPMVWPGSKSKKTMPTPPYEGAASEFTGCSLFGRMPHPILTPRRTEYAHNCHRKPMSHPGAPAVNGNWALRRDNSCKDSLSTVRQPYHSFCVADTHTC